MSNISKLSWTGVAREAVAGTAAATPTLYVPTKSKFQSKTKYVYLSEERATRDGNNNRKGTVRMASGDLIGSVYVNSIPYLLLGMMGGVTSTQPDSTNAPTAYSHALALQDVPPALTLFKGYDNTGYYFAYTVVPKLKIKFNADGKVLEYDAGVEGQYRVKLGSGPFAAMVPTYGGVEAMAGYAPTITIDSVVNGIIEDMEIDLEQKITLYYSARGNRAFLKADYGERTAKIAYTARFDDATLADQFDNETDSHINLAVAGKNLGGAITEKFAMDFPIVGYDDMEIDTSKDLIVVKAKGTARPGTVKNSLYTATVVNQVTNFTS